MVLGTGGITQAPKIMTVSLKATLNREVVGKLKAKAINAVCCKHVTKHQSRSVRRLAV